MEPNQWYPADAVVLQVDHVDGEQRLAADQFGRVGEVAAADHRGFARHWHYEYSNVIKLLQPQNTVPAERDTLARRITRFSKPLSSPIDS